MKKKKSDRLGYILALILLAAVIAIYYIVHNFTDSFNPCNRLKKLINSSQILPNTEKVQKVTQGKCESSGFEKSGDEYSVTVDYLSTHRVANETEGVNYIKQALSGKNPVYVPMPHQSAEDPIVTANIRLNDARIIFELEYIRFTFDSLKTPSPLNYRVRYTLP